MRIGLIGGTGKEGRGLSLRWARAGHEILIGSRDPEKARARAAEIANGRAISGGDNAWAASSCEVAVLTVPYSAHRATLTELKPQLAGKVLIDITVPLSPPKIRQVSLPPGRAAALEAQALLGPDTRVIAGLHHVSGVHLADPDHGVDCDVLVCADDASAMEVALRLAGDLGLRAFDAGPLVNAIALESLTPVLLHLNKRYGSSGTGVRITGIDRDRAAD
jgi:8-hydroxy-5-deazaflavin:NADPH oxidoreductase